MNEPPDIQLTRSMIAQVEALLRGEDPAPVPIPGGAGSDARRLADALNRLATAQAQCRAFAMAIADGNLDIDPPPENHLADALKQLHAVLRHLTWQTRQIAVGDLDQHVDFIGAFSSAFNNMIDSLREKRLIEENIRKVSTHDGLTGLYNRLYFNEELARLERSRRFPVSFIVAEIDGLKAMNDTLGHDAGDKMIDAAAKLLSRCVRADDVVARIGGDEFAVILPSTDETTAAAVMARIRNAEQQERRLPGSEFPGGVISLGVATARDAASMRQAMQDADLRMYADKGAHQVLRRAKI
jgi:two-component system, cell cycle response regulator